MIKVKITKNIIRKSKSTLGLSMKQIIIAAIAAVIGVILYFAFRNTLNIEVLMTLVFIISGGIIMFGCVNIQGQSLFEYTVKIFKGVDVRPYDSRGVFSKNEEK